jgi:hypothetical protein
MRGLVPEEVFFLTGVGLEKHRFRFSVATLEQIPLRFRYTVGKIRIPCRPRIVQIEIGEGNPGCRGVWISRNSLLHPGNLRGVV